MRLIGRCGGCALVPVALLMGCSGGTPGGDGLTFGQLTTATNDDEGTFGTPIDPTTGGIPTADDTERPPDETTSGPGTTGPDPTMTGPDTDEDTSASATTSMSDASTGPGAMCGDGMIDMGEDCDTDQLGGLTCSDVDPMFTGGTLACDGSCMFDTSDCSAVTNPIVECQMVNMTIPDNNPAGLNSTIMLPAGAVGLNITDVDVDVQLTHTYIGDLVIDVSHAGTTVLLQENQCTVQDDIDVIYDDEAAAALDCPQSASGLSFQPLNSLTALDGVATQASWSLFIEDELSGDEGTLQQWCVTISWM